MRKLFAATLAVALATTGITGIPHAAASSSLSSAPAVTNYGDAQKVLDTVLDGYVRHFRTRGYNHSASADNIARLYSEATPVVREQIKKDAAARGIEIETVVFPTNSYESRYRKLVDVSPEPNVDKQYGAYVQLNQYLITATLVYTR